MVVLTEERFIFSESFIATYVRSVKCFDVGAVFKCQALLFRIFQSSGGHGEAGFC